MAPLIPVTEILTLQPLDDVDFGIRIEHSISTPIKTSAQPQTQAKPTDQAKTSAQPQT